MYGKDPTLNLSPIATDLSCASVDMLLSKRGFASTSLTALQDRQRLTVIAAAKKQQKKQRKPNPRTPLERRTVLDEDDVEDYYQGEAGELIMPGRPSGASLRMPEAPSPSSTAKGEKDDESPYVVFAPKPSSIENIRGGAWGWDEEQESSQPPVLLWNPRTGFSSPDPEPGSEGAQASVAAKEEPEVKASFLSPSTAEGDLPAVSKGQILSSCLGTSFWMTIFAVFLRQYAQINAPDLFGTDPALLADMLRLPAGFDNWENVGITAGAVVLVTAARLQLLSVWPEFRSASNRSNTQVLQPLGWLEILLIAGLSGVTEELLFRGAIIPATFPDWRGAVASGLIFGLLHNNGGRNLAFAAWASAVGVFYGGLFVYTHNIWVPATAHALANFCSAAAWKASREEGGKGAV